MKFKYAGPLDAVDVPELGLVDVKRGQQVEATGAIATSLNAQADWQRVDTPKRPPRKAAAKKKTEQATPPAEKKE